jgi:positive regulator of sigma E activity
MLINSVLVGAFAGILAVGIFSLELIAAMIVSLIFLIIAFTLHRIYAAHIWQRETSKNIEVRFPSLEDKGETNN